ncbi:hypothetical protein [Pseudonocardia acidicola]|uniref:Antigen 84 n=1 Tax=Pseudonocardia acidicola TaxID=2724939 RepID=A0ABX1SA10_9PSEU|nr:hypothetical protein [Pseudonocardia acidicola]NMH97754.1 hypothetical protein [Pseudonocardia acidicola]
MVMIGQGKPRWAHSFASVRRGYDPEQVEAHLRQLEVEVDILTTDRDAALKQAAQFLEELNEARREIERLAVQLPRLSVAPESVESMNERLKLMQQLAREEFGSMHAAAAAYAAEVIAAAGEQARSEVATAEQAAGATPVAAEAEWGPEPDGELGAAEEPPAGSGDDGNGLGEGGTHAERAVLRLRREAARERARLHEAAIAQRAEADEEFRVALALRCREVLTQLAELEAESVRTAQRLLADVDDQARTRLAEASENAQRIVAEAQREVDELHELRVRLVQQLASSRKLIDRTLPELAVPAPRAGHDLEQS